AVGSAIAVDEAGPVLPVLVADACAHAVPASPAWARGPCVQWTSPPAPPLADRLAIESPPVTEPPETWLFLPVTRARELALPARSERTRAWSPPLAPLPARARSLTALAAEPVSPETALASLAAPLL